jgi:uncharacterized protein (TIGR00255 family)
MIYSMTGFGRGEAKIGDGTVSVEIRSVNHRFIDLSIRVPRSISGFEREIERTVRRKMHRGHIYVTVSFDRAFESKMPAVNREFLRQAHGELQAFADEEGIPGKVDINTLLALHEAFTNESEEALSADSWPVVRRALRDALDRCMEMRADEGAELRKDIAGRLAAIEKIAARIERNAPGALKRTLAKAQKRLKNLIADASIEKSRWMVEAAVIAERADFSEELVRLKSHLRQFGVVLGKGGEVSKKLTFLLQEIHREATTMGNKATESNIIRDCLSIKEAVEKIREQIQNIE